MSQNKVHYHTCLTRNDNETHVFINGDDGERCMTGMTEDCF